MPLFELCAVEHMVPSSTTSAKNTGKSSIPREQPNQNRDMKIADSVLLNLFMIDNEICNISDAALVPVSILKVAYYLYCVGVTKPTLLLPYSYNININLRRSLVLVFFMSIIT